MERLRREMAAYYEDYRVDRGRRWTEFPADNVAVRREIAAAMDGYLAENPDEHPSLLKARLHEEMAERFEPVIFPHSPFFYEMGLRFSENWGMPEGAGLTPGAWMLCVRAPIVYEHIEAKYIQLYRGWAKEPNSVNLWNIHGGFDMDHHCIGYSHLLKVGVNGVLSEIAERRLRECTEHEAANLEAMERSCRAVLRVAEKFRGKAVSLLAEEAEPEARRFLSMIAEAAGNVPANPPRSFYEGLAMLWFLREVTATLEAIGISVIGHPDRQLIDLYRADIAAGRLTEAEAADLLARWMLPTDIKFHVQDSPWPETSTCMELGGCDEDGNVVWNELTRLIIETHKAEGLINPKLNCRYCSESPKEYLDFISGMILAGHNRFALINDDVLIPAMLRSGKTEREARLYVNGGCQEPMCEGVEHTAGAYYYFNMARVLDLCLRPDVLPKGFIEEAARAMPKVVDAPDFETYYSRFMEQLKNTLLVGAEWAAVLGHDHWQVHPCPLFSTTLLGCIEHATDYTRGGAKYNQSGVALVGLGTVVDALNAIRVAVFEEKWVTIEGLRACLADNWKGHAELRRRILRLPRFGHADPDVDALAARLTEELGKFIQTVPSERGGRFQGSFFVYYAFHAMGKQVRATPNGRKEGEILTQGVAPDRTNAPKSLTDVFHSLSKIDFRNYPGNAVLDVQLPAGAGIPVEALSATIRTFAQLGGPTLQPNCVSVDDMRDAQVHPERHSDLVVRISGLSAHFVCLDPVVQQEIIERTMVRGSS